MECGWYGFDIALAGGAWPGIQDMEMRWQPSYCASCICSLKKTSTKKSPRCCSFPKKSKTVFQIELNQLLIQLGSLRPLATGPQHMWSLKRLTYLKSPWCVWGSIKSVTDRKPPTSLFGVLIYKVFFLNCMRGCFEESKSKKSAGEKVLSH